MNQENRTIHQDYELQKIYLLKKFLEKQGLKIVKEDYTIEDEYCYYLNFILWGKEVGAGIHAYSANLFSFFFTYPSIDKSTDRMGHNIRTLNFTGEEVPGYTDIFNKLLKQGFKTFKKMFKVYLRKCEVKNEYK